MMNRLLHKIARVIAVCTTMTIAPTLLWRMAERIGPSSMSIPLPIGVPRSPYRLDGDPQCAAEDTRSQNLAISMLPGDHCNNRSWAGLSGECRGQGQRSCAFGNDACLLRQHAHRVLGLLQADD